MRERERAIAWHGLARGHVKQAFQARAAHASEARRGKEQKNQKILKEVSYTCEIQKRNKYNGR